MRHEMVNSEAGKGDPQHSSGRHQWLVDASQKSSLKNKGEEMQDWLLCNESIAIAKNMFWCLFIQLFRAQDQKFFKIRLDDLRANISSLYVTLSKRIWKRNIFQPRDKHRREVNDLFFQVQKDLSWLSFSSFSRLILIADVPIHYLRGHFYGVHAPFPRLGVKATTSDRAR